MSSSNIDVTVVVPVWNGARFLPRLLRGLGESIAPHVACIFIDDCSTDGSKDILAELQKRIDSLEREEDKPHVTFIWKDTHEGFTRAVNAGIQACNTDVILLNVDIAIDQTDWVERLQEVAYRDEHYGIVAARLRDEEGRLNANRSFISDDHRGFPQPGEEDDIGQWPGTQEVETVTFSAVFIKRALIEDIGLLDERMVIYCSDSEYCLRARRKGWKIVTTDEVVLTHFVGSILENPEFDYTYWMNIDTQAFRAVCPTVREYKDVANIYGVVGHNTGYGKLCMNIARALHKQGIDVRLQVAGRLGLQPIIDQPLIQNMVRKFHHPQAPTLFVITPEHYGHKGGRAVGLTMFELDGLPSYWVGFCNQMDMMLVLSEFNRQTFRQSGVTVPIEVVDAPVDFNYYHPGIKPMGLPQARDFNLLCVCEWGERKWMEWLSHACWAFEGHNDVAIFLRVWTNDAEVNIRREILSMNLPHNRPPIIVINEHIPEYKMGCLYAGIDLLVSMGNEGFGYPHIEALAVETPVLVLGWAGGACHVTPDMGLVCNPAGLVKAQAKCPHYKGFRWAYPDWEHFSYLLRYAYEKYDEVKEQARLASKKVRQRYNLDAVGKRLLEILWM